MRRPRRLPETGIDTDASEPPAPAGRSRRSRAEVVELASAAPEAVFARCRSPRYWPTWLFSFWLRLTAALPWRVALALHKLLGRLGGALSRRRRHIVRRNLEVCFPDLDAPSLRRITARHFASVGAFVAELATAWYGSPQRRSALYRIEGIEHLHEALARGKGVVLYTGHFTPLEICAPAVKSLVPLYAFMFRPRRNPLMNALQSRGRASAAHVSVTNTNVREMLALLARNAVVWYSPDQASIAKGELVPFFSQVAMTSTAPSRLARLSGAAVVPLFYRRLPDDSGYLLRFHPPLAGIPSPDAVADTTRLMAVLEGFVRECPEQYLWTHRKFKNRPGMADAYAGTGA